MSKLDEIEKRRAARKEALAQLRDEQAATDLEALDALEEQHGEHAVVVTKLGRYKPGLPTLVVTRICRPEENKRWKSRLGIKGQDVKGDVLAAGEELARSCLLYPERPVFDEMCSEFTGLITEVGGRTRAASDAKATEEGKG